jgi:hypothetical protein
VVERTGLKAIAIAVAVFCTAFAASSAAAAQCPRVEVAEVTSKASAETRPVAYRGGTIHVSRSPLARLEDVIRVDFDAPWAVLLTFKPDVGERMERITARPDFPMAVVVDNEALVSVVLQGGFGIGSGGLRVSLDDEKRAKEITEALRRCVAPGDAK